MKCESFSSTKGPFGATHSGKKAFLVIIHCSNKVSMKQFFKNAHHDNAKAYFISLCKLSEAINVKV